MKPWGTAVNYNGKAITIRRLTKQKKEDGVSIHQLKKDFKFTDAKIQELQSQWKLRSFTIWKTVYFNREDVIKLI